MKKIIIPVLILLIPLFCFSDDLFNFMTIQANVGTGSYIKVNDPDALSFKEPGGFGIGAEFEKNEGTAILWHGGFEFLIPLAYSYLGPKFDFGLTYILSCNRDYVPFFTIIFGEDKNTTIEGKSRANFIGGIDIGTRLYALWFSDEFKDYDYPQLATVQDEMGYYNIMGYIGFRYLSVYAAIMPIQEVDIALHGLVGFVYNDAYFNATERYDPYTVYEDETIKDAHLAYGIEGCFKWYLFDFIVGYYDSDFYMEASLCLSFNILNRN